MNNALEIHLYTELKITSAYKPLRLLTPQISVGHTPGLYTSSQFAKRKPLRRVAAFFPALSEAKDAVAFGFSFNSILKPRLSSGTWRHVKGEQSVEKL